MSTDSPFTAPDGAEEAASSVVGDGAAEEVLADGDGVFYDEDVTPEVGIAGFTLRELLIGGVWLVLFALSFVPLGWGPSLWAQGIAWVLPVGVPTVAVFLIILRRFSPEGIRRVGSLGIDQFASVAFSVAAVWWAQQLWEYVAVLTGSGVDVVVWVPWVQFVLTLALVKLTVFAPLIPGLREDFRGRLVTLAHRNANPVRPVVSRPRPVPVSVPAAADQPARDETPSDGDEDNDAVEGPAQALAEPTIVTAGAFEAGELDVELSGLQATDEVARATPIAQVSISSHASAGGTGTEELTSGADYVPAYSRSSRRQEPQIVSDTGSIEELMGTQGEIVDEDSGEIDEAPYSEPEPTDLARSDDETDAFGDDFLAAQPFWILAPTDRDVHDEQGRAIFRIGPSAWALVIEDRGGAYVIRQDDGRIGFLHDIADITKG